MNPQIGQYRGVHMRESGGMKKVGKPGMSESSHEGHAKDSALAPHPHTGVTKVEIHHKAGGSAEVHTHHDGEDKPEVTQHPDMQSAHEQAKMDLPPEETGDHSEPDGDDGGAVAGMAGMVGGE